MTAIVRGRWVVALLLAACDSGMTMPPPVDGGPASGDSGPAVESSPSACSDGVDNDGDGSADCADEGCRDHVFCTTEELGDAACGNGIDDDGDGLADCDDPGCTATAPCTASPEDTDAACTNGVDDDRDGQADCSDTDCSARMVCMPATGLSAEWSHPGTMIGLRPTTAEIVFPTYIAHLFGTPETHPLEMQTTCVDIASTRSDEVSLVLEVRFPGYATPSTQTVRIAPGGARACLNPTFDLAALYTLTAVSPGRIESELRVDGIVVASDMLMVRVLPVNDVLWWHPSVDSAAMKDLSAVFVEPNASDIEAILPDVAARVRFRGSAGASGYSRNGYERPTANIGVDRHWWEFVYLEAGEMTNWTLTYVNGGTDDDVDVLMFEQDQYTVWSGGSPATAWQWNNQRTGSTHSFTAPTAGWYVFVLHNTPDNFVSRDVRWNRSPSQEEVVRDSLAAIFDELRARGVAYTSITTSFFQATQHVRRVSETLTTSSGNCIDGTIVFASLLELMRLDPVITYVSGHAFIGVRSRPDPSATVWFLETTMVGSTGSTSWNAYNRGLTNYLDAVSGGDPNLDLIPLPDARAQGIVPFSR